MPNLCAILEEHRKSGLPSPRRTVKIYGLPSGEMMTTAGIGADMDDAWSIYTIPQFSMINKAWLDELGLPVPTTLDEFHDALKAFKDNDMSTPTMETQPVPPFPCPPALMSGAGARTSFYSGFGFYQLAQRRVQ